MPLKNKKMKKFFIFFPSVLIIILSCSKNNSIDNNVADPIPFYSSKFLNDSNFFKFITTISKNNFKIAKIAKKNEGVDALSRITPIDSSIVYESAAENLTAMYFLEEQYPNFANLPAANQAAIMNTIKDSLTSVSFRTAHPNHILIEYEIETIPTLVEQDSMAVQARFAFSNISAVEFWACTINSGLGTIAEYAHIYNDLKWLAQNGSGSWGAVWSLAKGLVKNAVPWYKVLNLAGNYAVCLWVAG